MRSEPPATLIVGAGLVGASVGCALTRAGERVHLRDAVPSHAMVAASRGAGSVAIVDPVEVDLVVVAVPPAALAEVIAAALDEFPTAVVTDVGSVKARVARALRKHPQRHRYVGSHPMAGSQLSGPITADPDLFVDRTWVVTPHGDSDETAVARVRLLAQACGARVVEMAPHEHDTAVAQVSHLPQLLSSLMAAHLTQVPGEHLRLAGQGVRDVTRIAGSDPALWQQIVAANADAVRDELAQVHARLGELLDSIGDTDAVHEFLARGNAGTRALPGKHGHVPGAYAQVVVEIPDAPGALARLFADVEAAGVNVEDLAIEHDPAREVGFLAVSVTAEGAASLRGAMQNAGWTLR